MLQHRAMLANLTIHQWTARAYDKGVSTQVEKAHGAKDAGRFNKLLVDKTALEPMSKIASATRDYHYQVTLPWGDNGDRLLPAKLYLDYTQNLRNFISEFDKRANEFAKNYPALVQAARSHLGTMYCPDDYPSVSDIRGRFAMSIGFTPVPDAQDFRVDVQSEVADEIRLSINQVVAERQTQAVADLRRRIREVVSKIEDKLSVKDGIFRNTLIENCRDLSNLIPSLNVTDDPALNALHQDIQARLLVDPDRLRSSPVTRASTVKAAREILDQLAR